MINSNDNARLTLMIEAMEKDLKQKDTKIAALEAELKCIKDNTPMFISQSTFLRSKA
jgi:hypothetical protein